MKIVTIYGNMKHYDHGLSEVLKRVQEIFSELSAECESVDLGALHPPYYDGETTNGMDAALEKVRAADGIILACTAQMFAPTALMQSFVEYLEDSDYTGALAGKHCMLAVLSRAGGEKSAMDYLSRIVGFLGGFVVAQIGMQSRHLGDIGGETGEIIDKTVEDFYRAVKQGRKCIIPTDHSNAATDVKKDKKIAGPNAIASAPAEEVGEPEFVPTQKLHLQSFSSVQEQEIEELSNLFAQKFSKGDSGSLLTNGANALDTLNAPQKTVPPAQVPENPFAPKASEASAPVQPTQPGAIENMTSDLPNKFQSHLSAGLQATLQISITSGEKFEGFLHIHSTECTYTPGSAPAPDITIMADSLTWLDVLTGKTTAQKAFMVGGIKVRGDFVLLTKFDMLFNFGSK
ncbi:MAG: SCP2 sterol-binding domain-containing protein [Defluviitaleaceae bacterium]|nr:SCP2 sterol-binding domain-containing protein [Defluviitaleaceae bacterium]